MAIERISAPNMELSPHGGQLLSVPGHSADLLYLSPSADPEHGAIRGGMPIIAPWFGGLLDLEPSHGWARRRPWKLDVRDNGVIATCTWRGLALAMTVEAKAPTGVNGAFSVVLSATNKTDSPKMLQLAMHPYFRVSDATTVMVTQSEHATGFNGSLYDEIWSLPNPEADSETARPDAIATITDPGLGRAIHIRYIGADHTVVWNPGADAARKMVDLPDEDWKKFVCVEPAFLGPELQGGLLGPGQQVRLIMLAQESPLQ
ncbi:putative aldose 1-epimerase [Corynebacterium renale]|uniref:Glucose-6-phosphate 1-epimerase n=1 Tax=Corynebacterium renale TaxID=1724 RepID=A0A2A9DPE2_9CORY|nr:hypothetical protein [Corynebacterium renale]PFG28251.1 glucose-6-phosphate 1-epimerase [Corynebacterium renale]SQG65159.1 putative aldose 1-epimerase [Corynebacterium renale]SQI19539.1 putative aldose 1-epimerase [Corynebacterium renale]STC98122.1 putative aldose 1-epimerase [Corynebacterium renale]